MIKSIYFPDSTFKTHDHLFAALKENEDALISLKKTERKSDNFGSVSNELISKVLVDKGMRMEEDFIYPVINTTMLLDSHDDVQLNNSWNKSIKEQQGRIFYIADHKLELSNIIAYPQDVEMMLKTFTWNELGYKYDGSTQAMIFKIHKDNIKMPQALDVVKNKYPMQNSVRELYVKVNMAVNSTSMDFKDEKAVWDEVYGDIANKEDADSRGYFFAVGESKIVKEGSMVCFGSNHGTPILQKEDNEPSDDTRKEEPTVVTPSEMTLKEKLLYL